MIQDLDELYGILREPESVDNWERNRAPASLTVLDQGVAKDLEQVRLLAGCKLFKAAEKTKTYLWIVDQHGNIKIAVEEIPVRPPQAPYPGYPRRRGYRHASEEKKLGHPTLVAGLAARMAGELGLDEDPNDLALTWIINANSGRYSKKIPPTPKQMENVRAQFKNFGMDVVIDYD